MTKARDRFAVSAGKTALRYGPARWSDYCVTAVLVVASAGRLTGAAGSSWRGSLERLFLQHCSTLTPPHGPCLGRLHRSRDMKWLIRIESILANDPMNRSGPTQTPYRKPFPLLGSACGPKGLSRGSDLTGPSLATVGHAGSPRAERTVTQTEAARRYSP